MNSKLTFNWKEITTSNVHRIDENSFEYKL